MFTAEDFKLHCTLSVVIFLATFVFGWLNIERKVLFNLIFALLITMAIGFIWEIGQDIFKDGSSFSWQDLFYDFIGCVIGFLLIFLIWK